MPVKYKLYTYTEYLQIYQVDLALWSYYHSYQRTCPVYRGNCVDGGTVHLVVGTGGAQLEQNRYCTSYPVQDETHRLVAKIVTFCSTDVPKWIRFMNSGVC